MRTVGSRTSASCCVCSFKASELEGSGINKTVLEIGQLSSLLLGLLPLQFFVRLARLFEVHPDVTSHASRRC